MLIPKEGDMPEACMFDIMSLPEDTLKRVLPKVSIRMVSRLIAAYPRAIGQTMLSILTQSMSPCTIEFMKDEMNTGKLPTIYQIREAEIELMKTLRQEQAIPEKVLA
jgi:hypothetical protein